MKKFHITNFIFLLLPVLIIGQNSGIDFRKIDDLKTVIATAKNENKNIFANLHYVGCPHCVRMEKNVFNTNEVGEYYNNMFISLSLDINLDSLGHYLESEYQLASYPAYLYFDKEGNLQHKDIGYKTPKELIQIAATAFNDSKNFNYYQQIVTAGDLSAETLRNYFSFGYVPEKDSLINIYLENCEEDKLFSLETWLLLKENTQSYNSVYFNHILNNEIEYRKNVGNKEVDDFLISHWVFMVNHWTEWRVNDFQRNKMKKKLRKTKHPLSERVINQVDMDVCIQRAIWRKNSKHKFNKMIKEARQYHLYGYDDYKNYYMAAWVILTHEGNVGKSEIDFGNTLAKASVNLHKNFENLFIYAHFCKQMGNTQYAIATMNESLQYKQPNTNTKYIENANNKIEEWKNAL
ncbi:thioredoxin family protein [Saccharicrinis aurantiacus]|uniref:thioredoxin family protein n=1 Tax=Saccharicrinis aurantiacus TaxID=1849719 RepID=UPI0009500CC2|nr:thioredoxin family protein [Saccharicrinis aurantiacus]